MTPPKISLRAARVNAELTQEQVAKYIGVTKETIVSYESGKTIPKWDTVSKLVELYKYPADFIFFGKQSALSGE